MPHDPLLPRYVSKERARQHDAELIARLSGAPNGHVPYMVWSRQVNEHCRTNGILLANPPDCFERLNARRGTMCSDAITTETLLQYQEQFYADRYGDPAFTFDRSRIHLPSARVTDILDALTRGEVNYPLVVATPRTITDAERSPSEANDESMGRRAPPDPGRGGGERPRRREGGTGGEPEGSPTIHRVLMDRLIRAKRIKVWQRTNPTVDAFLDQVRDLTLADLTRTDLTDAAGNPVAFTTEGWLPYLQALYPTLPRPAATPGYTDLSFVAWERNPPADRVIPHVGRGQDLSRTGPDPMTAVTIQNRSQLDAVRYRYPLITPSRHLACFAQYHAATGEHLDTSTWSWMFGIVDPERFPDRPSVYADWNAGGLPLCRGDPRLSLSLGRLRCAR